MLKKSFIGGAITLLAMGLTTSAMAQETETYSNTPIRMPLDVAKGEPADQLAHIFAEGVKKHYGQTVQISNLPQQGGINAINEVVNSDPDGFIFTITNLSTLFGDASTATTNLSKVTVVSSLVSSPSVFVVSNNSANKDFRSFEAEAKKNKNKMDVATSGKGASNNLSLQAMKKEQDFSVNIVPFGNSAAVANDVIANKVAAGYSHYNVLQKSIQDGKLIPLAVGSSNRIKDLPQVPTLKELGFEKASKETYYGIVTSEGLTDETKAKMHEMVEKVLRDSEISAKIEKAGFKVNIIKDEAIKEQAQNENEHYLTIYKTLY